MKKKLLSLIVALIATTALWAADYDFVVDGIAYNNLGGDSIEVTSKSSKYLGNITIPATVSYNSSTYRVTSIGDWAFYDCDSLMFVDIPTSVTKIGKRAFSDCISLENINISKNVKNIGQYAFSWCVANTMINVENGNKYYKSVDGVLFDISMKSLIRYPISKKDTAYTIPTGVTSIEEDAFYGSRFLTTISLPNTITSIGDYAFDLCRYITSVHIPNSVTTLGYRAFFECYGLEELYIGDGLTDVRGESFSFCSSLTTVQFGNNVKSIGGQTFADCESIKSIILPASVDSLSYSAFLRCSGLSLITSLAPIPPYCGNDCFYNVDKSIPVYVPAQSVDAYKTADDWKEFTNIQAIEDHFENGYEYVDLGLSVKWATYNVGATKPEEYGDYFAWGETSPKTDYSWSTYKYCNGSDTTLTKYCVSSSHGTVDNKTILESTDDAAHVNWGGNWRMPTKAELEELVNNCTITWTDDYQGTGIAGRIITSKKTGYTDKSIFLPAAGARDGVNLIGAGASCGFWSSLLSESGSTEAVRLFFYTGIVVTSYTHRIYGFSVRPVCQSSTIFDPDHPLNPGYYEVSLDASPAEGGSVLGAGKYVEDTTITIIARANEGYTFNGWSDGVADSLRSIKIIPHDTALTAYFTINKYLVSFNNYDGSLLQSWSLSYGSTPQYTGATPTKPATKEYTYTFSGWSPAIVSVTEDAVYTAQYDSVLNCKDTIIVSDYQKASNLQICDQTTLIVTEKGFLDIDEPTTAKSLTFYVNNHDAAQIRGIWNLTIEELAMVLRFEHDKVEATIGNWYAFAVPFEVEIALGIKKDGASLAAIFGSDYVIEYYDGSNRATTQQGWVRCSSTGKLQPGKFYMMNVNSTQNTWVFSKKVNGPLSELQSIQADENYSSKAHHSGWNGLANTLWQSSTTSIEDESTLFATIYNNEQRVYEIVPTESTIFATACPFFVQVGQTTNVLFAENDLPAGVMARRAALEDREDPYYEFAFTSATKKGYVATGFISASADKMDEYIIGKDVMMMRGTGATVPQMWMIAYDTALSAHEAPFNGGSAYVPLGLYAPEDGDYRLSHVDNARGYDLVLYNNGEIVVPDATDTWTLHLSKGNNTTDYALMITPHQLPTDMQSIRGTITGDRKVIINNTLYILREGKTYNAQGGEVR